MAPAPSTPEAPKETPAVPGTARPASAMKLWLTRHRSELLLFAACYVVFACFSSQRFLRQSAAPHFVYQAKAWLDGRLDLDPKVLPNLEDWACARELDGEKVRCEGRPLSTDHWYVSFPWFPALAMVPFVALHGYQFNDTSFDVFFGALGVALFFGLLRRLRGLGETGRGPSDDVLLALTLGFGTLFFYCAIRGEVWFTAEVMGVALTTLYLRMAIRARHPLWAGLFFSMATLTRTPLAFTGLFFVLEALCPGPGNRLAQLKAFMAAPRAGLRTLGTFALGAAPLALAAAAYNKVRFGHFGEFGHKFLFNNRVNADIDTHGLFHPSYLARNLDAAFLKLPALHLQPFQLGYDPHGLSLLLTAPFLVLLVAPRARQRLQLPLWLTVAVCAIPGFFYQNDGYMQFGFRFSLDYTPYLVLLLAVSGWSLKSRWVMGLLALGVAVNFWGAAAFKGYTELVRGW